MIEKIGLWLDEKGTISGYIDIKDILDLLGNCHHGAVKINITRNKYKNKSKQPDYRATIKLKSI